MQKTNVAAIPQIHHAMTHSDCDVCTVIRRTSLAIPTFTAGQHDYVLMELIPQKTTKKCSTFTLNIQCRPKSKKLTLAALLHQEIAKFSSNHHRWFEHGSPHKGIHVLETGDGAQCVHWREKPYSRYQPGEPTRIPHSVSRDTCPEIHAFAKNAAQCS